MKKLSALFSTTTSTRLRFKRSSRSIRLMISTRVWLSMNGMKSRLRKMCWNKEEKQLNLKNKIGSKKGSAVKKLANSSCKKRKEKNKDWRGRNNNENDSSLKKRTPRNVKRKRLQNLLWRLLKVLKLRLKLHSNSKMRIKSKRLKHITKLNNMQKL